MGWFRSFLLVVLAIWLGCSSALAEKRVALVIGNSDYQKVARLSNPANDAAAIAAMLRAAGFDLVESKLNLRVSEMRKALRDFGTKARDADVAVVYYAGHGIELEGMNYLIPLDASLETDADVLDETVPLDRILFAVEPARHLRLVILDACRDNPFARTMKRTIATRAVGRGLAKVEPASPNTLIAFAAKAGSIASDGDSNASPFSSALVEHLPKPGLDIRKAFGYVRDSVLKNTSYKQEPFVYGSLGGDDVSLVPAKPAPAGPQSEVRRDYEHALQTGDRDAWEAFLRAYPTGFYADLARVQLRRIAPGEAKTAASEKAGPAQREKERLAAEEARKAEQAKAADAKAAQETRLAAEKVKQIEAERAAAAEAERARAAAAQAVADNPAAERASTEKAAAQRTTAEEKVTDDRAARLAAQEIPDKGAREEKLAALSPPSTDRQPAVDLPRELKAELRRVGCNPGVVDSNWNAAAQKSLELFNRSTGKKLNVKVASLDALDTVRSHPARVCPLICEHGYKAEGDACTRIPCKAGYEVGDDNTCERIKAKSKVRRQAITRERSLPAQSESTPARSASTSEQRASGQFICGRGGCRPVARGCRLGHRDPMRGTIMTEICN